MNENQVVKCFTCGENCANENTGVITSDLSTLKTTKHETKFTDVIKKIINDNELEIRLNPSDKLCIPCYTLINEYDRLCQDASLIQSVLNKQIFHTYEIESNSESVDIDKSKTFVELVEEESDNTTKYQCIHCSFETIHTENVNSHVLYHQTIAEKAQNSLKKEPPKSKEDPVSKKTQTPADDATKKSKTLSADDSNNKDKLVDIVKDLFEEEAEVPVVDDDSEEDEEMEVEPGNEEMEEEEEEEEQQQQKSPPLEPCKFYMHEMEEKIDFNLLEDPDTYSNLKVQKCYGCSFKPVFAADYVRHLKFHHRTPPAAIHQFIRTTMKQPKKMTKLTCPYCFTTFLRKELFHAHIAKMHESSHKAATTEERLNSFVTCMVQASRCKVCDYEQNNLISDPCKHEQAKKTSIKYDCDQCPLIFYSMKLYNNHLAQGHFTCFLCLEKFDDVGKTRKHFDSHLHEAPYKCTCCNLEFRQLEYLGNHLKIHPTNSCLDCKVGFKSPLDLQEHKRFRHADSKATNVKFTICDHCGKSFRAVNLYEAHTEVAHPPGTHKSFQCKICNNRFLLKYMLINHLKTVHNRKIDHLDEKFYSCYLCDTKFQYTARKSLIEHVNGHRDDVSYCLDCDASFLKVKEYDEHREKQHNDFSTSSTRVDIPKRPVRRTVPTFNKPIIVRAPEIKPISPAQQPKPINPKPIITKNELLVKPRPVPGKIAPMPVKKFTPSPVKVLPKIRVTTKAEQLAAKKAQEVKKVPEVKKVVEAPPPPVVQEPVPPIIHEVQTIQEVQEVQEEVVSDQQSQDSQNSTIVLPNNILVTEDGQIIIQNLDELMADQNIQGGQQSIINLEELLSQTNFVLQTEDEAAGEGGTLVVQQGEDGQEMSGMGNFIFQQEMPQQLIVQGEDSQGTSTGEMVTIEGMELVNGDYNEEGQFIIQPEGQFTTVSGEEGENTGQEVVLQEVVVDEETAQANQQTLDELSDILKEVAAQAEKPSLKRSSDDANFQQRIKMRKNNEKRMLDPSVPDNNNFSNFSAAFQHFVQGFDAKKKFISK